MSPKTTKVPKFYFLKKMNKVHRVCRKEMEGYISLNEERIHHFEYGRVPNHRTYKIVLKNGDEKIWELKRKN